MKYKIDCTSSPLLIKKLYKKENGCLPSLVDTLSSLDLIKLIEIHKRQVYETDLYQLIAFHKNVTAEIHNMILENSNYESEVASAVATSGKASIETLEKLLKHDSRHVVEHTQMAINHLEQEVWHMNIERVWNEWPDSDKFSGVFCVSRQEGVIFEKCCGYRNRSEELPNNASTAFGIASGTKLFTGLAVCKLLDAGKITLQDKLWDILPYNLGQINKEVTVFHLLTHTSGIGDYIDEEAENSSEDEQELCNRYPVYLWERLEYYLQMITPLPRKFEPGARFSYSNAGFVMLGLVIEAVSGTTYQQFVADEIILPLKLKHTNFYRMDSLPANTALGYTGQLQTNIFKLPILGGSDGGLYTCANDLDILWRKVFSGHLLSERTLEAFLQSQVVRGDGASYGLGVYRLDSGSNIVYYAVGGDFGVDFFTAYIPKNKMVASALGNSDINTYPLLHGIISAL